MQTQAVKSCSKCGTVKNRSEFYLRKSGKAVASWCKPCSREANLQWRRNNPDKVSEQNRKHKARWAADPAFKARLSAYNKAYAAANVDRRKNWKLKRKFGITLDTYNAMLAQQGGRCASCKSLSPGWSGPFHVDHDHDTGAVRSLLCMSCNTALGFLGDGRSNEKILRLYEYATKHSSNASAVAWCVEKLQ